MTRGEEKSRSWRARPRVLPRPPTRGSRRRPLEPLSGCCLLWACSLVLQCAERPVELPRREDVRRLLPSSSSSPRRGTDEPLTLAARLGRVRGRCTARSSSSCCVCAERRPSVEPACSASPRSPSSRPVPPASSPSPSGSALGVDRAWPAAPAPVIPSARTFSPCPADADGAGASSASSRDCADALRRLPLSCFERSLGLFSSLHQGEHVSITLADEEARPDLVNPAAPLARRHGLPQRRHPPPHRRRPRRAQRQQRRATVEE